MNLFTLKAKVILRVSGISGPFEQVVSWHVRANSMAEAKAKYEARVSQDFKHTGYQSIKFEYIEMIGEIL